jgi:hypothetical protein
MRTTLLLLIAFLIQTITFTQPVPKREENIPFLVTFGTHAPDNCENDARNPAPIGNYKSSILPSAKAFAAAPDSDNTGFASGPFNSAYGEFTWKYRDCAIKHSRQGVKGDDGNLCRSAQSRMMAHCRGEISKRQVVKAKK